MNQHAVYLSDNVYRLLVERAAMESKSVEQVAETLLAQELAASTEAENGQQVDVDGALMAVERLTNLFADVDIIGLERVLDDPMLELANGEIDMPLL
jgi:hypothetical protein